MLPLETKQFSYEYHTSQLLFKTIVLSTLSLQNQPPHPATLEFTITRPTASTGSVTVTGTTTERVDFGTSDEVKDTANEFSSVTQLSLLGFPSGTSISVQAFHESRPAMITITGTVTGKFSRERRFVTIGNAGLEFGERTRFISTQSLHENTIIKDQRDQKWMVIELDHQSALGLFSLNSYRVENIRHTVADRSSGTDTFDLVS